MNPFTFSCLMLFLFLQMTIKRPETVLISSNYLDKRTNTPKEFPAVNTDRWGDRRCWLIPTPDFQCSLVETCSVFYNKKMMLCNTFSTGGLVLSAKHKVRWWRQNHARMKGNNINSPIIINHVFLAWIQFVVQLSGLMGKTFFVFSNSDS